MDILALLACCEPLLPAVTLRQLALIVSAMLTMSGKVTMLGISRWTEKGGSYRTLQRFFATVIPWTPLLVRFCATHLCQPGREYILAGDETVISKAGTQTFGLDRLFSGLHSTVIKGLGFFVLSLVDVSERHAYPVSVRQVVRSEAEKQAAKSRRKPKKKPRRSAPKGRPKGSRNRDKAALQLSPELLRISEMLLLLLKLLKPVVRVRYLALDGHFGHAQALLMARAHDLHLISKLRRDAALYESYEGPYAGRGPRRKYGRRVRADLLPPTYLRRSEQEGDMVTNYYQGLFLHKEFGGELNVVVVVKLNLSKQQAGYALLFSSDTELAWEKVVEYYRLRFQIEFNFRAAKQHFGLEDFQTRTQTGVENAANLSFLMVNVSAQLLRESGGQRVGINDLKGHYRGVKYALATIKLVVANPTADLIKRVAEEIGRLGSIHKPEIALSSA
jgi:hypothetical protein